MVKVKNPLTNEIMLVRGNESFWVVDEETGEKHKYLIADYKVAKGEELEEGEEENEEEDEGSEIGVKTPSGSAEDVLSPGEDPRKKRTVKKARKAKETYKAEAEPDESEEELIDPDEDEDGEPDREPKSWTCINCKCDWTDNGYSDARCPECDCEYAVPLEG
ncbi:hypothetical protein KAU11_03085 [Candidatus Babeliales bacterium]|nr:hypothetical protein [Candidatus Babeliales bacterium]